MVRFMVMEVPALPFKLRQLFARDNPHLCDAMRMSVYVGLSGKNTNSTFEISAALTHSFGLRLKVHCNYKPHPERYTTINSIIIPSS